MNTTTSPEIGGKVLGAAVLALLTLGGRVAAQSAATRPNRVVIELKDFSFTPSSVTVAPGDTLVFRQTTNTPHNIQFVKSPKGAKFGSSYVPPTAAAATDRTGGRATLAASAPSTTPTAPPRMGPFLLHKGQEYVIVIGPYFPPGEYDYECTPHQSFGMKGKFVVASNASSS